jgi:DNA invertase Pin-like site-specific DNA recombinase
MDLVAYLRVSSETQLDGYGLDVQRKAVRAWARKHGHRIVQEHVDAGISGTKDAVDRPGLSDALDMLRPPPRARGLVVARLDRLARTLAVQEAILAIVWRAGAATFTVDGGEVLRDDADDPMRTAMRQVQGVFAQLDRALVEKRLRDGRRAKADAGMHAVGQHPYGWRSGGKGSDSVPDAAEQPVVERIVGLRSSGASYRAIAADLDASGIPPRRASTWSAAAVRLIVERSGAAGASVTVVPSRGSRRGVTALGARGGPGA